MPKVEKQNKVLFDWTNDALVEKLSKKVAKMSDAQLNGLRSSSTPRPQQTLNAAIQFTDEPRDQLGLEAKVNLMNDKLDLILQLFQMKA
jgi:hypothetical protein